MSTQKKKKRNRGRLTEQVVFRVPRDLRQFYEERAAEKDGARLSEELRGALERDRAQQIQETQAA